MDDPLLVRYQKEVNFLLYFGLFLVATFHSNLFYDRQRETCYAKPPSGGYDLPGDVRTV